MKLHELQEARASAVVAMRALADQAETEKRDLTADEDKKFGELKGQIADLDRKIGRAQTLAELERSAPAIVHGRLGDGAFEERAHEFQITKAIRSALPRDLGGGDVDAGFEREISQEVVRRSGRKFEGIAVPDQVFLQKRAFGDNVMLTSGVAASLVPTVHRPDLFIDRLRSALVVGRLGATVLDGLIGDNDIPKQIGSATAQWVGEDGALSDTALDFDDVQLRPKTVGAITSYSRRTLLNAQPSIEQVVRNDLAAIIANAIDYQAMLGDGSSNTPTGVVEQADVHEIDLTAGASWDKVLEFIASIQHADAEIGSLGWALNAWAVKRLRATPRDTTNGGEGFVMEAPNALAGYAAAVTSALPGVPDDGGSPGSPVPATIIFGAWSQLIVGYWSGIDLLLNPYESAAYQRGRVLVRAMRDCDVAVRHGAAFAFSDNMPVVAEEEGGGE